MARHWRIGLFAAIWFMCTSGAHAAEGDALDRTRFSVEAEFIITADYIREEPGEDDAGNAIGESHARLRPNMEDSDFFLSFDRRLFGSDSIGGAGLRIRMEENTAQPRLFGYFASSAYRLVFGRERLNNKFVAFPTPRNEDLIDYTHILSGALGEKKNSHHLYGDNIVLDLYLRPTYLSLTAFYHGRAHSERDPEAEGEFRIAEEEDITPGGGLGLSYKVPGSRAPAHFVQRVGAIYDVQSLERRSGEAATLDQYLLGAAFRSEPTDSVEWRYGLQFIRNEGLDDEDAAGNRVFPELEDNLTREASLVSMAYLQHRAELGEGWKAALIYARKEYDDISDGQQWTVTPNLWIPVAEELHLLAQVIYTEYGDGLVPIVERERDYVVQLGLIMELEAVLNGELGFDELLQIDPGTLLEGY